MYDTGVILHHLTKLETLAICLCWLVGPAMKKDYVGGR